VVSADIACTTHPRQLQYNLYKHKYICHKDHRYNPLITYTLNHAHKLYISNTTNGMLTITSVALHALHWILIKQHFTYNKINYKKSVQKVQTIAYFRRRYRGVHLMAVTLHNFSYSQQKTNQQTNKISYTKYAQNARRLLTL